MSQSLEIIRRAIDAKTSDGHMYLTKGVSFQSLSSVFEESSFFVIRANREGSIHGLIESLRKRIPQPLLTTTLIEAMESLQMGLVQDGDLRGRQLAFWAVFCETIPHVLLVDESAWVLPILEHCYADPISQMNPDIQMVRKGRALLTCGLAGDFSLEILDLRGTASDSIREKLTEEDTVNRILKLVGGDLARFEKMLEDAADFAPRLNFYRYLSLPPRERILLDIISVNKASIQPSLLHRSASFLSQVEGFTSALKSLLSSGLIERKITKGEVKIALSDVNLSREILASIGDARKEDIHFHLAQSGVVEGFNASFICEHFLKAKNELALTFVEKAIQSLRKQGEIERCTVMYEGWLELEENPERLKDAQKGLVEALENLGEFEKALSYLQGQDDSESKSIKARLLNRLGRFDETIKMLENEASLESVFSRSEANFALGRHEEILDELLPFLNELPGEGEQSEYLHRLNDMRKAISKVYIVKGKFEEAKTYLEENLELAEMWGWNKELSESKTYLGIIALRTEKDGEAKRLFEEALSHSHHASDHFPRACLLNMAILSQRSRQFDDALRVGFQAMRDAKRIGDVRVYANAARNVATVYQDLGAFKKAKHILHNLESEEKEDTLGGAWNLFISATLYQDAEEFETSKGYYEKLNLHRLARNFEPILSIQLSRVDGELGVSNSGPFAESDNILIQGFQALRIAEASADFLEMVESGERAAEKLSLVKKDVSALYATLCVVRGWKGLGNSDNASKVMRRLLERIASLEDDIPSAFKKNFLGKPILRHVFSEANQLGVSLPETLRIEVNPKEERLERERFSDFIGEDASLHRVFRLIDKVAPSEAAVLIYGESGTGKELVAEALHNESDRAPGPFVKVNCAALVEDLLLSELFGHEKGAFTGALGQKIGRFELADGGTIFLDEIGDISANTQVSLLRVLQEGTFERVGGTTSQKVDVRVVAATNKDLEKLVEQGSFRLDLYYRLKGVVIETPALRHRRDDVGRLAKHFVETQSEKTVSDGAIQMLSRYSWPGNIRELQNFMQSVLLFVDGQSIERRHIEDFKDFFISGEFDYSLADVNTDYLSLEPKTNEGTDLKKEIVLDGNLENAIVRRVIEKGESISELKKRLEIECIRAALIETKGNVTKAAKILQMKRPRLSQIIGDHPDLVALKTRLTA